MSSKARVLTRTGPLDRFEWGTQGEVAAAAIAPDPASDTSWIARARGALAAPAAPPVAAPVVAAPVAPAPPEQAAPVEPVEPVVTAEQQAHLMALEREAFTKGYAQGERAGLEAGGKRAEAMLRRVAQTLEELGGLRQTLIHETERQMVQLSLTLARRVVHREVSLDPELAAALAHVALEKLGTTTPATIRLNPEDYTIVAQDGERWGGVAVSVVPDPSIARGGCLVESDFGCVDATIERQFDELSRALLGDGH
jgi:flagellar assembly protein FliH